METKNNLPIYLRLDKDRILDNGGVVVGYTKNNRTFSDALNAEIVARYNSHDGMKAILQKMLDAFGHYCEGDPSDDEVEALKEAMELLK